MRIAIVQSREGYFTVVGPHDFKRGDYADAMNAAIGFHLEAGHLVAATYWADIDIPEVPSVPVLQAKAERLSGERG